MRGHASHEIVGNEIRLLNPMIRDNPVVDEWQETDWVMISESETFVASAMSPLGFLTHVQTTPLMPGESYTATASFKIPEGIEGARYIYVATDPNAGGRPWRIDLTKGTGIGTFPSWVDLFRSRVWEGDDKLNNVNGSMTDVIYREVSKVVAIPRGLGFWGDMVVTLKDGSRLEMKAVPKFREMADYINEHLSTKDAQATTASV